MNENIRIAYSEVFEILRNMNKQLVMKIPIEILESFKANRKLDYISNIDKNDIFNKNNISKEKQIHKFFDDNY